MLIPTRRAGETLMIGEDITITVREIQGSSARIGISAPSDISIDREDVFRREQLERPGSGETAGRT